MRTAIISNLFPPLCRGGYEIGAAAVAAALAARGCSVLPLSPHACWLQAGSGYQRRVHAPADRSRIVDLGPCLFGSLPGLMRARPLGFLRDAGAAVLARRRYRAALRDFRPQRILIFNPAGLVCPVLADCVRIARECRATVDAYVSDHWLAEWPYGSPVRRVLGRLCAGRSAWSRALGRIARRLLGPHGFADDPLPGIDRFLFCSRFLLESSCRALPAGAICEVIPWGLGAALDEWSPVEPAVFRQPGPLALVYAGQIEPHKGLEVVLRALAQTARPHVLNVVGDDGTDYAVRCKGLAAALGLGERVRFLGRQTHEATLRLLRQVGQVLVVPSVWEEPFSIVVLEGMAAGLPVLASRTGGTPEAIMHGRTGFLYERDRPDELAALLDCLDRDRRRCAALGEQARARVSREFRLERMVERIVGRGEGIPRPVAA